MPQKSFARENGVEWMVMVLGCGSGLLEAWNLDAHDFRAVITIQPSRSVTRVSPRGSLFFCGARLSDFHGLLVNVAPRRSLFRLWDLEPGTEEGTGTRFLDQRDGLVWLTSFGTVLRRVRPHTCRQQAWDIGVVAAGLAAMPDGTILMSSPGTGPAGFLHRLDPRSRRLTTWDLPEEQVPFSGVALPDGGFVFAERRTARIARFHPRTAVLEEWQLPGGSNPQVISRDRHGGVWFSDANFNNRIGRLDPERSTLALFVKPGVVTFSVRPVDRCHLGTRVAAADLASYLDVVRPARVPGVPVPPTRTVLRHRSRSVRPALSSAPMSAVVIPPTRQRVEPVDPPDILRYPTPVVAPTDVVRCEGAIYATAGVFDEHAGPSRLFRLAPGGAWPWRGAFPP